MKSRTVVTVLLLVAVYLVVRLPNLRAQPVFCDEATYLRWAQMIHQDPWGNAFVSMEDAKPPLHYWILAAVWPASSDSVLLGRLVSVMFGALTIPVLLALVGELTRGTRSRFAGVLSVILVIACPLVAMNQRMVLAEPLLLLEAVLLGWWSLRLARRIGEGVAPRRLIVDAVVLGLVWAATLLTKQNFSYLLWVLPPAAILTTLSRETWRRQARVFVPLYLLATGIGLAFFVPVLFTSDAYDLRTRLFYKPMFTSSSLPIGRGTMILQNVAEAWGAGGPLMLYVTAPVLALGVMGALSMLARRMPGPVIFLGVWCGALLGGLMLGANVTYSRYLLLGAIPVLIWAAWAGAELAATRGAWKVVGVVAIAVVLIRPAWRVMEGARGLDATALTRGDREQYVDGGGEAVERAIVWLRARAAAGPITVVTGSGLGLQNDLTWVRLRGEPNVQLLCDDGLPPLKADARGNVVAGLEQWRRERVEVTVSAKRSIYYLASGMRDRRLGSWQFLPSGEALGGGSTLAQVIAGHSGEGAVGVFQLSRVGAQASAGPDGSR